MGFIDKDIDVFTLLLRRRVYGGRDSIVLCFFPRILYPYSGGLVPLLSPIPSPIFGSFYFLLPHSTLLPFLSVNYSKHL